MSDTKTFRSVALEDVVDPDTYRAELLKTELLFPEDCAENEPNETDRA